jgi:hypothetical protein
MAATIFTDHARVVRRDGTLKMRKRYPRVMVPGTKTLLLSDESKMPTLSWSMPAGKACPWSLYGEGTICGSCYARKGRYIMPSVAAAQEIRFQWTLACLRSDAGRDEWVSTMTGAIRRAGNSYFRGHDSADMLSPDYVWLWVRVAKALPEVKFWFPTRVWRVLTMSRVSEDTRQRWALALMALASLPNVIIRPSALFFNAPAPKIEGLAAGSTAFDDMDAVTCPAYQQGDVCGSCRACWDQPDKAISYHRH